MKPFRKSELKKPNFFDKLFKKKIYSNISIELRNYLAELEKPPIDRNVFKEILSKYNGVIPPKHLSEILEIYKEYFKYCLQDNHLDDSEFETLRELKIFLQLRDKQTQLIEENITSDIYKKEISKVLSDHNLSSEEREFLEKLRSNLRMSETFAEKIYSSSAQELVNKVIKKSIADGRLSPDEENEIIEISKNLGVSLSLSEQTKQDLDYYRYVWLIENGEIPSIEVDIKLQKDEECYFYEDCSWNELRKTTKIVNYGGIHLNYKIVKGVNLKFGSTAVFPISTEEYKQIDVGTIYITNKRLIFMGPSGNKTINFNKILDVRLFPNELLIEKDSGKSPLLIFKNNFEIFTIILRRILSE